MSKNLNVLKAWVVAGVLSVSAASAALAADDQMITILSDQWYVAPAAAKGKAQAASAGIEKWHELLADANYSEAVKLWPQIAGNIPLAKRSADEASFLYALMKLRLAQTFVDEWFTALKQPAFASSEARKQLDQYLSSGFDRWLLIEGVQLSEEQQAQLQTAALKASPAHASLVAWTGLKNPASAEKIAATLPASNALKLPLVKMVAVEQLRKGRADRAAAILAKGAAEAEEAKASPADLGGYYLQLGRLAYEAQDFKAAREHYAKVSRESPDFLIAREELTWVLLQQEDNSSLRGQLATLTSGVADARLTPEAHLVRAISNMKLCHFASVEQDIKRFVALNGPWAKEIDQAFRQKVLPEPRTPDFFSRQAQVSVLRRQAELDQIAAIRKKDVPAGAISGNHAYWAQAQARLTADVSAAAKRRQSEFSRQWRNDRAAMEEAARKMRFVKAEWMNEVRVATAVSAGASKQAVSDEISLSNAAPVREEPGELKFAYDGVIWTDELFKLRSAAENRCRAKAGDSLGKDSSS